ncbi:MAG TPA: DUF3822 family protein [Chitinophagaceae bacterium]
MTIIARNQNNLLKQLFHIISGSSENPQKVLSIRLGEKHGSFAITDRTGNELYELSYCSVEEWNENFLTEFFTRYPSIHHSFYQVVVAYDTPQSVLTPSSFYKPEGSQVLLKIMAGVLAGSHMISELIPAWQLYNTYAVPDEIYKWINQKFPSARSWHQFSLAIKNINAAGNEGSLAVDFRQNDFTVIAARQSRILLAQTFEYTTHGDVLYYLLKTCGQFSLAQKEVNVQLSGLVDKQSALYKEIYQYFINIEFREAGWNTGTDYPAHFFTSLNDLAQCAS